MTTPPRKRLVLCLDGTWNSGFEESKRRDGHTVLKPTNPLKLARAVLPWDDSEWVQITYYDLGVGALAEYPARSNKVLQRVDRVCGGAWGAGFEGNVEDALNFLALNFENGDEVFVFGFSRGAAEARAVTEFLDWNQGLPEKEDVYYLPQLFRSYVSSKGAAGVQEKEIAKINDNRSKEKRPLAAIKPFRPIPVKYLGVWDTVVALGSRLMAVGDSTSTNGRGFYAGDSPAGCVQHARQALAIDESRFDFRPEIWKRQRDDQHRMEQRWFAGVHSNVGGSYGNDGLANIAFHWILGGAVGNGLKINEAFAAHFRPFVRHTMYESNTTKYRVLDKLRRHAGGGRRSLVDVPDSGNASVDPTVFERMLAAPSDLSPDQDGKPLTQPYRPENVIAFLAKQPDPDAYLKSLGVDKPLPDDVKRRISELR